MPRRPGMNGTSCRTILATVALIAAAYVLVGQFSHVNLLGTLGSANPAWIAVAVLSSAVTYFAAAQNLAAFVPKRLHPLRGSLVQLSTAFVGVAMPPTVGHVAVNARYLHKEGVDEGSISAAVTLSQLVNIVTTVLLLVVIGLLTGSGLSRFKIAPGGNLVISLAVIADCWRSCCPCRGPGTTISVYSHTSRPATAARRCPS